MRPIHIIRQKTRSHRNATQKEKQSPTSTVCASIVIPSTLSYAMLKHATTGKI